MADAAHLLDGLRPLHIASGENLTTAVVLMALLGGASALVVSATLGRWLIRRRALRRKAIDELDATRALSKDERLVAQAALLRGLVARLSGDAAQTGEAWLACLDKAFSTSFFSQERGQIFGDALYRPHDDLDIDALDAALRGLFARLEQ